MAQTKYRSIECPISVRADGDTATAVLATSAPVARYGIMEVLQIDRESIDLSRSPFPLLLGHKADESPIGVVDDVRIQNGELIGTLRFGDSVRAQEALKDARAQVLRSVSIGYRIDETQEKYGHTIATKWTLLEVSLVSVPADQNARITQIEA
jgi:Phage head maturation protease